MELFELVLAINFLNKFVNEGFQLIARFLLIKFSNAYCIDAEVNIKLIFLNIIKK